MRSTDESGLKTKNGHTHVSEPVAAKAELPTAQPKHIELGLSKTDLLRMHYQLVLARLFDERIWMLNRQGKTAFVISSAGQEGDQVAFANVMKPGFDIIFPYYRNLALVMALGVTPREVMLGQLSRAEDPSGGGRQMPSHFGHAALNINTVSSPVATQLPQAAGAALASKIKQDGKVSLVFVGDGGTSKGDFHEALNFASVHALPVIFVVENNGYAISVPLSKQMHVKHISERAVAYNIPGVTVDGNDVLEVYRVAKEAEERARRGDGPTLIEAVTYRYRPHSSSDDDRKYRSKEEVDEWKQRDPIVRFERYLEEHGLLTKEDEDAVRQRVRQEVDEAQAYAEAAPYALGETALKYVYAEENEVK
jgi:2-oxoisovalerate dehydrogenase E1 component alpha subunit